MVALALAFAGDGVGLESLLPNSLRPVERGFPQRGREAVKKLSRASLGTESAPQNSSSIQKVKNGRWQSISLLPVARDYLVNLLTKNGCSLQVFRYLLWNGNCSYLGASASV